MSISFPDLGNEYRRARDIVRDIRISNPSHRNWYDSNGYYGSEPSGHIQPIDSPPDTRPEVPQIDQAIDEEIKRKQNVRSKLVLRKGVYQRCSAMVNTDLLIKELEIYAVESRRAQKQMLTDCSLTLIKNANALMDLLRKVSNGLDVLKKIMLEEKLRLEKILNSIKYDGTDSGTDFERSLYTLKSTSKEIIEDLSAPNHIVGIFAEIPTVAAKIHQLNIHDHTLKMQTGNGLSLLGKSIQDFFFNTIKNEDFMTLMKKYGENRVIQKQQIYAVGKFLIDFAYNNSRFYLAWSMIDEILLQIDNTNSLRNHFNNEIKIATNQVKIIDDEIMKLQNSLNTGRDKDAVLYEMRQKDLYNAWLAGEWFGQRTGLRAPGKPVEQ